MRGSWRPNITEIFWPPLLWPSTLCLSCSPDSGVHSAGCWLSLLPLISIFSGPQLISAPSPFGLVWLSLPHLVWNCLGLNSTGFCSIRRPYITFKLPRGDMGTPPRLRNFFRYLATGICHFRYLWNDLCDRHRVEITVMQFTGHSLPVHQSMSVPSEFFKLVPFHQPISAHAISSHNCHWNVSLPSGASPWNGIFGRVKRSKYNIWRMQSIPSLSSLSGPFRLVVLTPESVLSMCQIELFHI